MVAVQEGPDHVDKPLVGCQTAACWAKAFADAEKKPKYDNVDGWINTEGPNIPPKLKGGKKCSSVRCPEYWAQETYRTAAPQDTGYWQFGKDGVWRWEDPAGDEYRANLAAQEGYDEYSEDFTSGGEGSDKGHGWANLWTGIKAGVMVASGDEKTIKAWHEGGKKGLFYHVSHKTSSKDTGIAFGMLAAFALAGAAGTAMGAKAGRTVLTSEQIYAAAAERARTGAIDPDGQPARVIPDTENTRLAVQDFVDQQNARPQVQLFDSATEQLKTISDSDQARVDNLNSQLAHINEHGGPEDMGEYNRISRERDAAQKDLDKSMMDYSKMKKKSADETYQTQQRVTAAGRANFLKAQYDATLPENLPKLTFFEYLEAYNEAHPDRGGLNPTLDQINAWKPGYDQGRVEALDIANKKAAKAIQDQAAELEHLNSLKKGEKNEWLSKEERDKKAADEKAADETEALTHKAAGGEALEKPKSEGKAQTALDKATEEFNEVVDTAIKDVEGTGAEGAEVPEAPVEEKGTYGKLSKQMRADRVAKAKAEKEKTEGPKDVHTYTDELKEEDMPDFDDAPEEPEQWAAPEENVRDTGPPDEVDVDLWTPEEAEYLTEIIGETPSKVQAQEDAKAGGDMSFMESEKSAKTQAEIDADEQQRGWDKYFEEHAKDVSEMKDETPDQVQDRIDMEEEKEEVDVDLWEDVDEKHPLLEKIEKDPYDDGIEYKEEDSKKAPKTKASTAAAVVGAVVAATVGGAEAAAGAAGTEAEDVPETDLAEEIDERAADTGTAPSMKGSSFSVKSDINIKNLDTLFEKTLELCTDVYMPLGTVLNSDRYFVEDLYGGVVVLIERIAGTLFIAFRGTHLISDWLINVQAGNVGLANMNEHAAFADEMTTFNSDIEFHSGFLASVDKAFYKIFMEVEKFKGVVDQIIVTGHSKGGAEAAIFTYAYNNYEINLYDGRPQKISHTITYGSPRVLVDKPQYVAKFNNSVESFVRVFNADDPVPFLPFRESVFPGEKATNSNFTGNFVHVGKPFALDTDISNHNVNIFLYRILKGNTANYVEATGSILTGLEDRKEILSTSKLVRFMLSPEYLKIIFEGSLTCLMEIELKRNITLEDISYLGREFKYRLAEISDYSDKCELLQPFHLKDILLANKITDDPALQSWTVNTTMTSVLTFLKNGAHAHSLVFYKENLDSVVDKQTQGQNSIYVPLNKEQFTMPPMEPEQMEEEILGHAPPPAMADIIPVADIPVPIIGIVHGAFQGGEIISF